MVLRASTGPEITRDTDRAPIPGAVVAGRT